MGGLARPPVRDRHQQGRHRHQGGAAPRTSRSPPSSTPIAIPTASPSWCRAMTTRAAPSRSIAISSRRPRSTASRARRARRASISAPRPSRSRRNCRRRPKGPATRCCPVRAASPTTSRSCPACLAGDREEAQRSRHLPLLADRRARSRGRAQDRRGSRAARPHGRLDRAGERTDRRVTLASHGPGRSAHSAASCRRLTAIELVRRAMAKRAAARHDAKRITDMANITAQMVKELRERTGAGMMDCKAALQRNQRRHGSRRSICCARRVSPRPPRRPAASPPKA